MTDLRGFMQPLKAAMPSLVKTTNAVLNSKDPKSQQSLKNIAGAKLINSVDESFNKAVAPIKGIHNFCSDWVNLAKLGVSDNFDFKCLERAKVHKACIEYPGPQAMLVKVTNAALDKNDFLLSGRCGEVLANTVEQSGKRQIGQTTASFNEVGAFSRELALLLASKVPFVGDAVPKTDMTGPILVVGLLANFGKALGAGNLEKLDRVNGTNKYEVYQAKEPGANASTSENA